MTSIELPRGHMGTKMVYSAADKKNSPCTVTFSYNTQRGMQTYSLRWKDRYAAHMQWHRRPWPCIFFLPHRWTPMINIPVDPAISLVAIPHPFRNNLTRRPTNWWTVRNATSLIPQRMSDIMLAITCSDAI